MIRTSLFALAASAALAPCALAQDIVAPVAVQPAVVPAPAQPAVPANLPAQVGTRIGTAVDLAPVTVVAGGGGAMKPKDAVEAPADARVPDAPIVYED